MDRSVTLWRKRTQANRDGGSGCYPRVRGENPWWFGGKGGGPITCGSLGTCLVGTWQVVGRGSGENSRMVTVEVERGRVGIARPAPAGRRGTEPGGSVTIRRIGRGPGVRR